MVCLYCGKSTRVVNSRLQRRNNHTWRRRACEGCGSIFTTLEQADLATGLVVKQRDGRIEPFNRDNLFLAIHKACAHRPTAIEDASALTQIITSDILHSPSMAAEVAVEELIRAAQTVLGRYDKTAATVFTAYYGQGSTS